MHSSSALLTFAFATLLSMATACDIFVKVLVPQADKLTLQDVKAMRTVEEVTVQLLSSSNNLNRNLRANNGRRLDPVWCDSVCASFPYPYCQVWNRECYDHRRRALLNVDERAAALGSMQIIPVTTPVEVTGSACDTKKKETLLLLEDAVDRKSQGIVDEADITCYQLE